METNIWAIISSIATALGFIIISITAVVALFQFIEMNKTRTLEAFFRALDELSTPDSSEARRYVYNHELPAPDQIIPGTDIYTTLYKVYLPFDKVGLMLHQKLISEKFVMEMYGESIIIIWKKLKPHILAERRRTQRERYQMYFEELYQRSVKYLEKYYPQQTALLLKAYPDSDEKTTSNPQVVGK